MGSAVIAIVVLGLIAAALFFATRKPAELPAADESDESESDSPRAKDPARPSLTEKLDQKRAELAQPKEKADPKASAKSAEKGAEKPKEAAAKASEKQAEKPADKAEPKPAESAPKADASTEAAEKPATEKPADKPIARDATKQTIREPLSPQPRRKADPIGLRKGLAKSRGSEGFFGRLAALVRGKRDIDPELLRDIEDVLLTSDVGVKVTGQILTRLRDRIDSNDAADEAAVWDAVRQEAKAILDIGGGGIDPRHSPTVVMMVGVNGAGKTTTIGKLATKLNADGKKVILAAGDTFRAAAVAQLEVWGKRVGCEVVKGKEGADPASVIFDAVQQGRASGADVVLVDTAGRLQTKTPLMDELRKIGKTMAKAMDGAPHETLLVVDSTTGQNALTQANLFQEALPLTGVVLTKLDGTAKGGVILSICEGLGVPVRYIGLGERADDLHEFAADEFVEALFGDTGRASDEA
jgi:fused signal recognition particle receptor